MSSVVPMLSNITRCHLTPLECDRWAIKALRGTMVGETERRRCQMLDSAAVCTSFLLHETPALNNSSSLMKKKWKSGQTEVV